jgi:hypothetical protein
MARAQQRRPHCDAVLKPQACAGRLVIRQR